jgi:serine/threonine protein phosphatase 1
MNILVVGDVHGCYHTFKELVDRHWDPSSMHLIQLGDLIRKGPHSAACLQYAMSLQEKYPEKVSFLMGNHEWIFLKEFHSSKSSISSTRILKQIRKSGLDAEEIYHWLFNLPYNWTNSNVFISHAGWAKGLRFDPELESSISLLFNKKALKRLNKMQIVGHVVQSDGRSLFKTSENAWFIDTGAWLGKRLTGLLISEEGEHLSTYYQELSPFDISVE